MKRISAFIVALIFILNTPIAHAAESPSEWAEPYIDRAISLGFLPEALQGRYTDALTRQEFTYIAIRLISALYSKDESEITKNADTSVFADSDDIYAATAYSLGIIEGKGDGSFAPKDTITRQEAAKILVNTYAVTTGDYDNLSNQPLLYSDYAEISDWAKPYVNTISQMSVMEGMEDNSFSPFDTYTREQGIVTFLRLYEHIIDGGGLVPDMNNKNPEISAMLKVKDGALTDGSREVVLNGINLGGWLLMESWMSPVKTDTEIAYSDIMATLTNRFGKYRASQLIKTYEDNFITESDFAVIEALGFNCVRIPFWYKSFTDENGNLIPNSEGYKRLDWALEQCAKHGIYAILDMHGCPGGQSMNHTTGIIGKNELYGSEKNLRIMERLWTDIAKRYKDNIYVAAYDIMNEPQNNSGYSGKNAWQAETPEAVSRTNAVYERMISAIRKVDKNHIITIEGIWTLDVLPDPAEYGWTNMMYQLHVYDTSKDMIDLRVNEFISARKNYGVAPLVGEYNSKNNERYASVTYDKNKISRIKWTYKTVGVWYDGWGLFNKDTDRIDIKTASYDEIEAAFGTALNTENGFELNLWEYNMIKK